MTFQEQPAIEGDKEETKQKGDKMENMLRSVAMFLNEQGFQLNKMGSEMQVLARDIVKEIGPPPQPQQGGAGS